MGSRDYGVACPEGKKLRVLCLLILRCHANEAKAIIAHSIWSPSIQTRDQEHIYEHEDDNLSAGYPNRRKAASAQRQE